MGNKQIWFSRFMEYKCVCMCKQWSPNIYGWISWSRWSCMNIDVVQAGKCENVQADRGHKHTWTDNIYIETEIEINQSNWSGRYVYMHKISVHSRWSMYMKPQTLGLSKGVGYGSDEQSLEHGQSIGKWTHNPLCEQPQKSYMGARSKQRGNSGMSSQ